MSDDPSASRRLAVPVRHYDARRPRAWDLLSALFLVLVTLGLPALADALTLDVDRDTWVVSHPEAAQGVSPEATLAQVQDMPFAPLSGMTRPGEVTWLRLQLHNPRPEPLELVAEIPYAGTDAVRFVVPSAQGRDTFEVGQAVPIAQRPIREAFPAAPVRLDAGASGWAYVRVNDGQAGPVQLFVHTEASWQRRVRARAVWFGVFLGFALLAVLWNVAQYVVVRERSSLDYALYITAFSLYVAWWLDGMVLYVIPMGPQTFELGALALMGLTGLALLRFFRSFLDTATTWPRLDRVLSIAGVVPFLALVAWPLIGRGPAQLVAAGSTLALVVLLATTLGIALREDFQRTRYFALAWGLWAALLVGYPLGTAGLHANITVFVHGPRLAFMVEVALLGLALADRLNRLKLERQHALERELEESRHAALLGQAFERYVPKQFLSLMDKRSILEVRRGDSVDLEMSVLFSDIRGFTTMAEDLGAEQTFRFIDEYLGMMEPALAARGGFINDIFGDGIMALFDGGAQDAVAAALGMLEALDRLNDARGAQGLHPLAMGIGVHTGRLMLGTIGGETRLDCTVVGDPANLAARIEGMTSQYGSSLLISEHTRRALGDDADFHFRWLDRVQAKGKGVVIDLYEVLDAERGEVRAQKEQVVVDYEAALAHYLAGRFDRAVEGFRRCAERAPMDRACALLLDRSEVLAADPPSDWPGHTRLLRK